MSTANILLIFTCFISVVLAVVVLASSPKRAVNRIFALFMTSVFLWLFTNLLTNTASDPDIALVFGKLTLVGAALIPYTFLLFCYAFIGEQKIRRQVLVWGILPFIILLTTPTSLNIQSIDAYGRDTVSGPVYYLLIIELLSYAIVGFAKLLRFARSHGITAAQKSQVFYIFAGAALTVLPAVVTNAVLPLMGYGAFVFYGPNIVIVLSIFMAIAIVRHRLLDIRLVVARSLGYILSIAFLAALFGLITFALINTLLFTADTISTAQQITYTVLAVVIAFAFPPIKRFFDKVTNKIFYRDAYDPQKLLNDLNKTLVSTIELKKLLQSVSGIIAETLKTEFVVFDIKQGSGRERVVGSSSDIHLSHQDLIIIQKQIPPLRNKVIRVDELEGDHHRLQKTLRDNNIAVVAHLTNSVGSAKDGLGYLLLGDKKSGNPYSSEDVRTIEIIADELVIAVQNALRFDEIQNFNITLQEKVDDATRKLRRTNEKLKQLDATKDDFISMASHQLRTPLTSVKGYVSMVLDEDAGKITAQQRKLLEQSFTSSQRMVFLIADLLNVSRLKTGKFIIEAKPTNLADVVGGEIEQLVETAKGRDLKLEYHKPKDFPTLNLDETKIRQVIMNFVDNAIYYTPAGGTITVNLVDKPESIEFTVVDSGLGVPKHEQQHLFTKFYRAQNAKRARPDGTGLGLFMAKKVIIAQGGAVIFKSVEGKGSTFGFTFPKKRLAIPATAKATPEVITKK